MSDHGSPPVIPPEFAQYNSYVTDPLWQRRFTTIWCSILGFFVLLSIPRTIRAVIYGRGLYSFRNWVGIRENDHLKPQYDFIAVTKAASIGAHSKVPLFLGFLNAFLCWRIPRVGLNFGQIILVIAYATSVLVCILKDAILIDNGNRAGFLALAQLPVVFLFSSKNSVVSLLLGPGVGYEKLNFMHRWSGRIMILSATLHGALWISNQLSYGLPVLGQDKEMTGIAAFSFLGATFLVSLRPLRTFAYQTFVNLHLILVAGFYIAIFYHTPYTAPWIYIPPVIYGLDMLLRMVKYRFKDAVLVPIGNQMTLIHIPHATSGWVAGQHVRIQALFPGRTLESHPFTIFCSTPEVSCITSMPSGLSLGVGATGDWTRALNKYANETMKLVEDRLNPKQDPAMVERSDSWARPLGVPIQVLVDGPYGGSSVDIGDYETVVLFTGGSGITFSLGLLDDIVGRCVRRGRRNGERTKRIEFTWCIRSFGQLDWFSSALIDIATVAALPSSSLYLHISVYVTCLCNPDAVPSIPNCDVILERPCVYQTLRYLISPPNDDTNPTSAGSVCKTTLPPQPARTEEVIADGKGIIPLMLPKLPWIKPGGGMAVCVSGPESLVCETANAVSRVQLSSLGRDLGRIALHTETFAL